MNKEKTFPDYLLIATKRRKLLNISFLFSSHLETKKIKANRYAPDSSLCCCLFAFDFAQSIAFLCPADFSHTQRRPGKAPRATIVSKQVLQKVRKKIGEREKMGRNVECDKKFSIHRVNNEKFATYVGLFGNDDGE